MRRSNYPLRLRPWLMEEARKVAESERVSLNQLINVAVADKLAFLRAVRRFQERIRHAGRPEPLPILYQARTWNPPVDGDKILTGDLPVQPAPPPDLAPDGERAGGVVKVFGRATPQFGQLKRRLEKTRGR
jgi:hypothetical protein